MKAILIFTLFTIFYSVGISQNAPKDIIHLKSGEKYEGYIIEQHPGQSLSLLQMPQKDTLQFLYTDIEKIAKEINPSNTPLKNPIDELPPKETVPPSSTPIQKPVAGDRLIQIHYAIGGGDFSFQGLGATLSQALNDKFYLGIGVHYINDGNGRGFHNFQSIYPIVLDLKYQFSQSPNQKFSTYLVFSGGIFFPDQSKFEWEPDVEVQSSNRIFLNPSIAFKFEPFTGYGLMFDIGYQYISANFSRTDNQLLVAQKQLSNISLRGTLYF